MTKKIVLLFFGGILAFEPPVHAAFRFGLANSAAKRGSKIADQALPSPVILKMPLLRSEGSRLLWPFGVQGGGHPQGHPGIDFAANIGASVYASANGRVREVSDRSGSSAEAEKVIIIDHAQNQGAYVGSFKNIAVSVGDFVVQGQKLAELEAFAGSSGQYGFLHWGLSTFMTSSPAAVCPYDYLTDDGKAELTAMFTGTIYSGMAQFPLLCNPCPSGGCR